MNRKEAIKDLFIAVKKHLMKRVARDTAIWVSTNVACRIEQNEKMTIEDIKKLTNVFLATEE